VAVVEHRIELGGAPIFYRTGDPPGPGPDPIPPLYIHGAPTSSDDFVPFLERTGGIAPDMLGFGRSAKGGNLTFTIDAHADFVTDLLDHLEVDRVRLVGHAGGAATGLVFAQRHPDRVERLALLDPLPLFAFPRSRRERILRARGLGELAMGSIIRRLFEHELRRASVSSQAWPPERLQAIWEQFDQGTQRAILRMLRDSDDGQLERAGARLASLTMPALIVWGERDPWLPVALADEYARRLPHAELRIAPNAGHWPWLDDPGLIEAITDFLK
jgi:pimeloyl-ACP methyl ester carboxylesterase